MREGHRESLIASVVLLQDMIKILGGIYRPPFDENGFCADREGTKFTVTWHREAFNIARDAVAPYPVRGGEQSRKEAFWRTYMEDRTRQQRPAPEDYNDLYRLFLTGNEYLLQNESLEKTDDQVARRIFDMAGVAFDNSWKNKLGSVSSTLWLRHIESQVLSYKQRIHGLGTSGNKGGGYFMDNPWSRHAFSSPLS
jgi:hypothetical protein